MKKKRQEMLFKSANEEIAKIHHKKHYSNPHFHFNSISAAL